MDAMVVYFHRSNERGNGEDRLVGFSSAGLSGCGGSGPGSGPGEGNKEAGISHVHSCCLEDGSGSLDTGICTRYCF